MPAHQGLFWAGVRYQGFLHAGQALFPRSRSPSPCFRHLSFWSTGFSYHNVRFTHFLFFHESCFLVSLPTPRSQRFSFISPRSCRVWALLLRFIGHLKLMSAYDIEGLEFIFSWCMCVLERLSSALYFLRTINVGAYFGIPFFLLQRCLFLKRCDVYLLSACTRVRHGVDVVVSVLPFLCGFQDWTLVLGPNGKHLRLLSRLTGPVSHLVSVLKAVLYTLHHGGSAVGFETKNYNLLK